MPARPATGAGADGGIGATLADEPQAPGPAAVTPPSNGGAAQSAVVAPAEGGAAQPNQRSAADLSPEPAVPATGGGTGYDQFRQHLGVAPGVPPLPRYWPRPPTTGGEEYAAFGDNPFLAVDTDPLSTFSIDVDTAAYANVRRFIEEGRPPPADAVRIEEMINYFTYDYPRPDGRDPFSITSDGMPAPWAPHHRLVRVGLATQPLNMTERPPMNLVFLIDVSGSMNDPRKLPLLKRAFHKLIDQLRPADSVAIVTYAGFSGVALEATSGAEKDRIHGTVDALSPGGSTHASAGLRDAYRLARAAFVEGGVNRVVLATDGDFNVGITDDDALVHLIEDSADDDIFLTVLGFGMGNLKDATLETVADKGNGNYAYIDTAREADKVFGNDLGATLVTVAKDVKVQVEFNPAEVGAYRLIGYEDRALAAQDFSDDTKDAGEVGAGHQVTVLYELAPPGEEPAEQIDLLRNEDTAPAFSGELMYVKVRYKRPENNRSLLLEHPIRADVSGSRDLSFAASVAAFGMLLRDSPHRGAADVPMVLALAENGMAQDRFGYRAEFVDMVRRARWLHRVPYPGLRYDR